MTQRLMSAWARRAAAHLPCLSTQLLSLSLCASSLPFARQMYGFGLVSCAVDNANSTVKAQLGGSTGWATVSLEQLLAEHQKRAAAKPGK